MLNDSLRQVCVLGAAGKMGSGIALLLLQEMARLDGELTGTVGEGNVHLLLIDVNPAGLDALKHYLRSNLLKYAERNINALRRYFIENPTLVSNEEIIDYFVDNALDIAYFDTDVAKAHSAKLVFEAVAEDVETKSKLLQTVASHASRETLFLTNTSSIPIHILDEKAHLHHRLVGFHFYNPPAVQKLVELILPGSTDPRDVAMARELAKRLQKTVVESKDVAGFIGNGHLIREIQFAMEKVRELSHLHTLPESIYIVNRITQDYLIRPMGIFQLIDYVGLDICQKIFGIMSTFLPGELFQDVLIDEMVKKGIVGGQYPDGTQKDGFFQYEGSARKGIYAPMEHNYLPLGEWTVQCDKEMGPYPHGHASWKQMQRDPERQDKLIDYFANLCQKSTLGAELAHAFLKKSRDIARHLVSTGVARRIEDVDAVLENGFFHLYGPDAPWLDLEDIHSKKGH